MASRAVPAPGRLRLVGAEERAPSRARRAADAVVASRVPYLLVGTTVALTALGLVMVLSASNVYAKQDFGSSFWFFKRQAMYATVGIAAMVATSFLVFEYILDE